MKKILLVLLFGVFGIVGIQANDSIVRAHCIVADKGEDDPLFNGERIDFIFHNEKIIKLDFLFDDEDKGTPFYYYTESDDSKYYWDRDNNLMYEIEPLQKGKTMNIYKIRILKENNEEWDVIKEGSCAS